MHNTTGHKHLSVATTRRSDHICVQCTIFDDSVSSCAAVIHPTYKFLRGLPYGLMNISVSRLRFETPHSNTITDCVQHLSASSVDYHIAVFAVSNSNSIIMRHPVKKLSVSAIGTLFNNITCIGTIFMGIQ